MDHTPSLQTERVHKNMFEGITLALHKDTGKDTHRAMHTIQSSVTVTVHTVGCIPPPHLGSNTRFGCLWHYSTAVQGQPGTKKQRELP